MILLFLIVVPLWEMIKESLQLSSSDARKTGLEAGAFTFNYWKQLFCSKVSRKLLYEPLLHSLTIALSVSVLSIAIGGITAWLMVRTDLPFKRFFSLAIIVPYMLPAWCKAMAWIAVFKNPRIGGTQGFLSYLGIHVPDWLAYGPIAIILVLSVHNYAYTYLLVSSALKSVNTELEEMAEIAGAGRWHILTRITFPLVLPSVLGAFILTFSQAMGTFSVPAFLGLKTGYYTISTMLQSSLMQGNNGVAMAISIVLIAIASLNILINQKLIGTRKSFVTISGKGGRSGIRVCLGKWKPLITLLMFLFIGAAVLLPLGILTLQSFMLKLGDFGFDNLTLHYWIGKGEQYIANGLPGVLRNPDFMNTMVNTLKLVLVTSVIAALCGQLVGYINSRGKGKLSGKVMDQLVFIPYLIPSIAFGAMYLSMFSTAKTFDIGRWTVEWFPSLYGTFALLVLVSVVKNLPFSSRSGTANMMQIGTELEEAAQISGAGFLKRMIKVIFPLSKSGFLSGFLLIFINVMKELDLIIILITPQMKTLPYMAYSYLTGGTEQYSNVVALIMFMIVFIVYCIAGKFSKEDVSLNIG
ncbi:MAG: ABC transporter permease [Lachnospiraceae bacterium]